MDETYVVLRVGVVGYSAQKFDENKAIQMITEAYERLELQYPSQLKMIVSGLTNQGIPAMAYREAVKHGWKTKGVACSKSKEYDCFPVDEIVIIGSEWGDESQIFLDSIDLLIRIGGGKQSMRETAEMKNRGKPVIEYDLERLCE